MRNLINPDLCKKRGTVEKRSGVLAFEDVPIIAPNADTILPKVSFEI